MPLSPELAACGVEEGAKDDIEMALQEALLNAVSMAIGKIRSSASMSHCAAVVDGEVQITIRDEGTLASTLPPYLTQLLQSTCYPSTVGAFLDANANG